MTKTIGNPLSEPNPTGTENRKEAKVERKKCPMGAFSVSEASFAYPNIDVTLPLGHTVEDALQPEYWALHANRMMRPDFSVGADWSGAIIHLRTVDHSMYAQLYVRAVRGTEVTVALIGEPTYFGPKSVGTSGYHIRWNVGARAYDILRKSDNQIVAQRIKTKEDAQSWIEAAKKAA